MTARDAGGIASRVLSIYLAVNAFQSLEVVGDYLLYGERFG